MIIKCPNCGSLEESKFCTKCGQDLRELRNQEELKLKKEAEEKAERERQREAEEKAEAERVRKKLHNTRIYDEAVSYMEHAEQTDAKAVAAEFYRKAEKLFESIIGWEDAEDKILECARKAKASEIALESELLAARKAEEAARTGAESKKSIQATETKEPTASVSAQSTSGTIAEPVKKEQPASAKAKSKSKTPLIAALICLLVIAGIVVVITQHGGDTAQPSGSETAEEQGESNTSGEVKQGDLIAVEDAPELAWGKGTATLTHYQLEKTEDDGDCINLYFDFKNTGDEDISMSDAFMVDTYQNGYELEQKTFMTLDAEQKAFNQVRKDVSVNAATGFRLNDASEVTVVMLAYDKDDNLTQQKLTLSIPENDGKAIEGNKNYFEETNETPISDGLSISSGKGEIKLTGYKYKKDDNLLILYYDFTNNQDTEASMTDCECYTTVYQNGVEQESGGWSEERAEDHYFLKVQKGNTMHCAYSYEIQDNSDITVKFTTYSESGDMIEKEQTFSIK